MKKIMQLVSLCCLVLSSASMIGDEPGQPARVELGLKEKKEKPSKEKVKAAASKESMVTKSALPNRYHPYYFIKAIGAKGTTLSTYDETVWQINPQRSHVVQRWTQDMPIIIQLNHSIWSWNYDYCLKNANTNESVPANLALGPFAQNALFITDMYDGVITLTNGSRWHTYDFKNWKVGQAVLIGESDKWFSPYYILININENNYTLVNIA